MRKKILMFQWYDPADVTRRKELIDCIEHNLKLGFDEIIIINSATEPQFFAKNVINMYISDRMTYSHFVNALNDKKYDNCILFLTNTDIKLDEKILDLGDLINRQQLFCLSRYEQADKLTDGPSCSQDTWIAIAQPIHESVVHQSNIPLGLPGCENRLAEIFFSSGFNVFNPCYDIKNIHVQNTNSVFSDNDRVFGAYLFVPPCTIDDILSKNVAAVPVYFPRYASSYFYIPYYRGPAISYLNQDNPNVLPGQSISRNDSCPCGSKKKYKNCHGKLI
jgi:hypothetical protein